MSRNGLKKHGVSSVGSSAKTIFMFRFTTRRQVDAVMAFILTA
jgi:hypothetical protein